SDASSRGIYTLSLHDALPIFFLKCGCNLARRVRAFDHEPEFGVEEGRTRVEIQRAHEHPLVIDRKCLGVQARARAAEGRRAASATACTDLPPAAGTQADAAAPAVARALHFP